MRVFFIYVYTLSICFVSETCVYLCDFHREQAWERWLKASHNGVGNEKSEVLHLFRCIAHSKTVEEFDIAKASLEVYLFKWELKRIKSCG